MSVEQTTRSLCMMRRHGKREAWPSSMMTCATDDVFHDAAGGVGHGRERPSYRPAWPDLHVLLAPVFAGKDRHGDSALDRPRDTPSGQREDAASFGGCGKHCSSFPQRGSW